MAQYWQTSTIGVIQSGAIGAQGHFANGLTALFLAIAIYTFWYIRQPSRLAKKTPLKSSATTNHIPLADTPLGLTTFAGLVKDLTTTRVAVQTAQVHNGRLKEFVMLVAVTPQTPVYKLGPVPSGIPTADNPLQRERTPATIAAVVKGPTMRTRTSRTVRNALRRGRRT